MRFDATAATLVIACAAPFAEAAPGDPYHKAEWCHTSGESGVHWGTGDCESATATIESFPGYSVKGCTDLTEGGVAPHGGNFADILQDPAIINSGPLVSLGSVGQGVTIALNLGDTSHGSRLTGIRRHTPLAMTADITLPQGVKFEDLRGIQIFRPGEVGVPFPHAGDPPLVNNIQGDFEMVFHVADPQNPMRPPTMVRQPMLIANLSFAAFAGPCGPADVDVDQDVDVFDLILFLQNFNPNATCPAEAECAVADINADGTIDVFDLIAFLQAFDPNDPNCRGDATPA